MRINNIIKYDLETQAKELKGEGKTLEDISQILTEEAKNRILFKLSENLLLSIR